MYSLKAKKPKAKALENASAYVRCWMYDLGKVTKKIWFLMGQPCGKRMAAQLPEWLAFYAADEGVEYENVEWVLGISAATL